MAKSILVVDDDATVRELLSEILAGDEFTVETAPNGLEALWELQRRPYDLVLLDIWMPKLNGLELLAELRAREMRPKVIVMTADNTPETLLRAVREQAYQYVSKPVKPEELLELVRGAVASPPVPGPVEVISASPHWVELLVPCETGVAERLQGFLERLEADLPEDVRRHIGQAFRELLLNAIEWGGELDPNRKVRISYLRARRMLLYRIADPGTGFRFEGLSHAAVAHAPGQPLEHVKVREQKGLRPGGFGILLAQSVVDELLYNEAQNEVVFIKYLD